jgi:hypothetical protein
MDTILCFGGNLAPDFAAYLGLNLSGPGFWAVDFDLTDMAIRLVSHKVYGQQTVRQLSAPDFYPVSEDKSADKLAARDAPMKVFAGFIVFLAAADDELIVFNCDLDLVAGKASHGQRDPEPFGPGRLTGWRFGQKALDIVGRVAVATGLPEAIDEPLNLVEPEQQRAR